MKRNTALFGASLVAGVAAAGGLIATGVTSNAASTFYGTSWSDTTSDSSSGGWTTSAHTDDAFAVSGVSAGRATVTVLGGVPVTVRTTCSAAGTPVVRITGGGAAGTYTSGTTVSLAKFASNANLINSVTIGSKKVGGVTAGAYIDLSAVGEGSYVAVAGAKCQAAATTSSSPGSSSSTAPSSSSTAPSSSTTSSSSSPSSSSSSTPTSTTSSTTSTPTPTTSTSTTSPSPTTTPTEPPTPTATTTTLPVTG